MVQLSAVRSAQRRQQYRDRAACEGRQCKKEDRGGPEAARAEVEAKDMRVTVRDNDEVLLEGKVRNWD